MSTFTLDSSLLAGAGFNYDERPIEERGRSISVKWSQGGRDEDMELFGYSIRFLPTEPDARESS